MSAPSRGIPRPVEAAAALVGLGLSAPILACAGALIRATSPGPIVFRQERVGKNGVPFTLYKLRTMRQASRQPQAEGAQRAERAKADGRSEAQASRQERDAGVTAKGDARITRVGRILRKTKLDELPELWNVVIGDLSLVGPRPEVPRYVDLADPTWQAVLRERPGLTHPVTLALRNEEELLAAAPGDPSEYYEKTLLPYKLNGCLAYQAVRTWRSDLRVLTETVLAVVLPSRAPPPTLSEIQAARSP
jgi:lipopolysaccharide/colanic/teichoic acid biosynthesis glycosyltransferase